MYRFFSYYGALFLLEDKVFFSFIRYEGLLNFVIKSLIYYRI